MQHKHKDYNNCRHYTVLICCLPPEKPSTELTTSVWQKSDNESEQAQGLYKKRLRHFVCILMPVIFPSTNLVVEQKEPLWKQLPSGPPSGRRDTACQDFQRGAAENSIRQEWFISLSQLPEFPNLDFFLTSQVHHRNYVSLLMIPVWAQLILARCVHTNELLRCIRLG